MAGAAGLLGVPRALGAEGALETTTVRLTKRPGICLAPQYVAEEVFRAEGFAEIRYVNAPPGVLPLGQYQGIPRADPGGRVTSRF